MVLAGFNTSDPEVRWDDRMIDTVVNNVITVALCIFINYINGALVYTFLRHEMLRKNPRYVLYIHLVLNDMMLMITLTLIQLLSYIFIYINVSLCIVLLVVSSAADFNNPLTLLFMALECYIAVCYPLRHSQICTVRRTRFTIAFIWFMCALSVFPAVFSALAVEPLQFFHSNVRCFKTNVFRPSYVAEQEKIFDAVVMAIVWFTLIYAYLRIMFSAKSAAADAKKARNTVLLHSFQLMLSMLSYVFTATIKGLLVLFPNNVRAVRFGVTITICVLQRLISPLIYGLRDKTFRNYLKPHIFCAKATR